MKPKKKNVPKGNAPQRNLRIYATAASHGSVMIAAEELGRQDGKIHVRDPAIITRGTNDIGFSFGPLKWVDQPYLYESALLMDDSLPSDMIPYFEKYQAHRVKERE